MPKPVFIPLAAGLQTELADELVQPGATLVAENIANDFTGSARVRLGADVLSTATQATIPAGGALPIPWQLATLEGTLVRFGRAPIPLHTWAPMAKAWVAPTNNGGLETFRRGPIKLDTTPVFSGTAQVSDPTVAVGTDTIVEVYQLDTGNAGTTGPATVILDRLSRRPLFTRRAGNARGGRVAIVGTHAVVAYEQSGHLQVDSYNLVSCTLSQQVTLGAVLAGTPIDMRVGAPVAGANNVGILYRAVTTGNLTCSVVDATNLASNSTFTPRTTAAAVVVPNLAFGWMQDAGASGKFAIMIADTTNGLRALWDLPSPAGGFSNAVATHVLDAAATGVPSGVPTIGIRNLIGTTITNSATGVYRVLYEMTSTTFTVQATIKVAVWNGAASLGIQYKSVGIRSKFWQHAGQSYFLAAFDGQDQRAYFVLAMANDTTVASTTFSAPLAVALPRAAGGFTENVSSPSDVGVDSDGAIFAGVSEEIRTDLLDVAGTASGTTQRLLGASLVRMRHPVTAETEIGRPTEFIKSLFVPGGLLGFFDGASYGSPCFPYYPPGPAGGGVVAQVGGPLTASAQYAYRFVYGRMDRNGRVWRSAPSAAITGATTGVNKQFLVTVDTLRLVDRGPASGQVADWIEVYRTQGNAPGAYFQACIIPNDPTSDTLTVIDAVPDVSLGEELYTDGGGLENQLLPSISCVVEYQGRLICAEAGRGTIWYSTEADFTNGLIFNEALTEDIGDPNDPITALVVFGEQLIVFKAGRLYVVSGQGANALGQGGNYDFRLVDPAIGCSNPQSIVVSDDGVWFHSSNSRAGIHRTAGGMAEYVGQGVHAFDGLTISAAVIVRDQTQLRFYSTAGITLVWSWTTKTWSTNTLQPCLAATTGMSGVAGVIYARASDFFVLSEATVNSAAPYVEGGVNYLARVRSPWYRTGGTLGGFGRVKRLQGVGTAPANHRTVVNLYRDMNPTFFQSASIVFDSFRPRWDWEIRPAQQAMSAFMVEVEILPFVPPSVSVTPDGDNDAYNGIDVDTGGALFHFQNGSFTALNIGSTVTIQGTGGLDNTYTIIAVTDGRDIIVTPVPVGGTGTFTATTITVQAPLQYTAGPNIMGVSLVPVAKEGADKLGPGRRLT